MKHLSWLLLLVASYASAAPQNNMCVPRASGVPTREGPPKWLDWTGTGPIPADDHLDDPRWLGSTGHTFALGSAKAPLQARALISTQGISGSVTKFLYLSVIVDLDGYTSGSNVTARDLFIGFHRPSVSAAGDHGYILQLHLTGSGGGTPSGMQAAPVPCDDYSTCDEDGSTTPHDYWRVFADRGNHALSGCSATSVEGRQYDPLPSSTVHWITSTATPGQDAVRYWKIAASDPSPFAQNRWAVQIRIPIVPANAAAAAVIADGVEDGSSFFYEATARLSDPMNNGPFATVGWFPPTMTRSICPNTGSNTLISEEMSDAGGGCTNCDPLKLSALSDEGVPLPPGAPACDAGLDIDFDHVGVVFNAPIPAIETITSLGKEFFARDLTTPNHIVALPFNTKAASGGAANTIHSRIQARFRLAEWGAAPWSVPGDIGKWNDIRGAESGVCATSPPPPPAPPSICGQTDIDPQKHGLITFDWTIGADTGGMGSSEYCQFGLHPPAASGETCSAVGVGCPAGQVRSSKAGGGFWPCVPSIYQHDQCMLVELNSPDGSATFVHQSIWSNMRFGQMSTLAHEALIDARALPTAKDQKVQDIYLVVVPRNMPRTVPANTTTVSLAQSAALNVALQVARPYLEDLQRTPPDLIDRLGARAQPSAAAVRLPENDERVQQILRARRIMSPADARKVDGLLRVAFAEISKDNAPSATLVRNTVAAVGSSTAAEIVPTLEIYPYYAPLGKGRAYQPMTSFSLFLSHEDTLGGIHYEIDGADKVGANIYHLQIPVGYAKKIQVRAQALAATEPVLGHGNPRWPCAGGCAACGGANRNCGLVATVGNSVPGILAGVLVIRRRRKRKASPPAAA
ncbi:MAG TPA: hypothetical protein VGD37_28960 [Kofleriaceae bacterium]|jgi:hypothetical protein